MRATQTSQKSKSKASELKPRRMHQRAPTDSRKTQFSFLVSRSSTRASRPESSSRVCKDQSRIHIFIPAETKCRHPSLLRVVTQFMPHLQSGFRNHLPSSTHRLHRHFMKLLVKVKRCSLLDLRLEPPLSLSNRTYVRRRNCQDQGSM